MSGPGSPAWARAVSRILLSLRSTLSVVRSLGETGAAWLDLAIRVWLAKGFLMVAAVSVVMHAPAAMRGSGALSHAVNGLTASPLGAAVQTLCPVLLMLGLGSRVVALPLLIQACLLQGPEGPSPLHLFWAVLLGRILVLGPGSLSLDALLGRGIVSTAIPGADRLGRAFAWSRRRLGSPLQLLVRLWIGTAPLAMAAGALGWSQVMSHQPIAPWLASVPAMTLTAAPSLLLASAWLLVLGLGTRIVALILVALVPLGPAAMSLDDRLYWALLLTTLVVHGPGAYALDALLDRALAAASPPKRAATDGLPHVIIVGGGFGGVATARGLRGAPCRVTLVDRRNYHLFQPLLYQIATAALSPADVATPIRSLFRRQANVRVLLGEVDGVRPGDHELCLGDSRLAYDILVLATGARHSYFGRDAWAGFAPGLKTVEDATEIRRRLLTAFERAETSSDATERRAWMTFVVVGGGPTGVELAGAIAELARHGLQNEFRDIDPASAAVVLVQSAPRLLPSFPAALSADAAAALTKLGVEVRLGAKVEQVDEAGVVLGGERLAARTILWAAGVAASPAGQWLGVETDKAGRIVVAPDLSVPEHGDVFAIGDVMASTGPNGTLIPGLAPAAKQSGAYVARVIRARLTDRACPAPFRYRHVGSLATIGRQSAVAEFGPVLVRGALAWWIWGLVHILVLAGGRNRAAVALQWGWAYLTYGRGTRLITDHKPQS